MMTSRILKYSKNVAAYDFLTQFSVKNPNNIPTFSFFIIKIQNLQTNDVKQVCLNLVSAQLVGNNYVLCKSQNNVSTITLKCTGDSVYFIFENIVLLAYKNKLENLFINSTELRVQGKNFLNIVEYFTVDLKFLKHLENTSNNKLKIFFSCQFRNSKNYATTLYFLKSLGFFA